MRRPEAEGLQSTHLQLDEAAPICRGQAEQCAAGDAGAHHQLDPSAESAEGIPWLVMDPAVPSKSPFWKNYSQHSPKQRKSQKPLLLQCLRINQF